MRVPWDDWQFWVVTAAALVALGWLLRGVVPVPYFSAHQRRRRRERRVNLTVGGKSVR
jgi:hypothetical protein